MQFTHKYFITQPEIGEIQKGFGYEPALFRAFTTETTSQTKKQKQLIVQGDEHGHCPLYLHEKKKYLQNI